ncbi:MAG: flagellar protein FliT [Proteobacteria bacterium]|nr:flagellar protein FliT [Pseudomonadota bacterium]
MVAYENVLETYGAMSVKSAEMVEAAQHGDWERLIALEKDCSALVTALKPIDKPGPRPDAGYVKRKVAFIRKVLADDAEIRRHAEPWMTRLQAYLGSARQEQRLLHAYEGGRAG